MIDRRLFIAGMAGALVPVKGLAQPAAPTARDVFSEIKRASGQKWDPNPTDDRIIFGNRGAVVTGIATCFTASIDVLGRARAARLNYIVPHEASFYERYDDFAESALPDSDPVLRAKKAFLTDNRMIVQRMHAHAHSRPGDAIMTGMLRKLGWEALRVTGRESPPWVRLPPQSARDLGLHIKTAMGLHTLRMFGDPARTISTVSLSGGMPGENIQIQQLESGADAVFLGEVREPEVLGYAQDMAADRGVTVYLVGHTNEDAGMGLIADWLKTIFPSLPVQWLPTPDPYTNPS